MTDLDSVTSDLATTLTTKSPPGQPEQPHITTYTVGTVTAHTAASATVEFPSDPALSAITLVIPYLGPQPANGDLVLVAQLPHQRIIMGVISH